MIKLSVHHISFPVSDLDRSKVFYQGILGLKEIPRPDIFGIPGMWLVAGQCEVHLIEVDEKMDVGSQPKMINPAARHAAFAVDDYEETVSYLKTPGLEVFETNAAIGQMWIADPDGHVIELIQSA